MGMYLPKKYKRQFYHSCPNSHSGIPVNSHCILVWNALHLVIPLYSLCVHFTQPSCGFISANGIGILVYFPTFVILVDTSKDCHLANEPVGRSAPLKTLYYIQPCCSPYLYPSKITSHLVAKSPAIIEDDTSQLSDSDALIWLCFSHKASFSHVGCGHSFNRCSISSP